MQRSTLTKGLPDILNILGSLDIKENGLELFCSSRQIKEEKIVLN